MNNEAKTMRLRLMRLPPLTSISLQLMQHQDITYIRIILFWFLTNLDWFLKQSSMLELLETIGNSVQLVNMTTILEQNIIEWDTGYAGCNKLRLKLKIGALPLGIMAELVATTKKTQYLQKLKFNRVVPICILNIK